MAMLQNTSNMTTICNRNTVQINARTLSAEKYTNKQYNNTLHHKNLRITTDISNDLTTSQVQDTTNCASHEWITTPKSDVYGITGNLVIHTMIRNENQHLQLLKRLYVYYHW